MYLPKLRLRLADNGFLAGYEVRVLYIVNIANEFRNYQMNFEYLADRLQQSCNDNRTTDDDLENATSVSLDTFFFYDVRGFYFVNIAN